MITSWMLPLGAAAILMSIYATLALSGYRDHILLDQGIVVLSVVASILGSMIGLGGGLIVVPILVLSGLTPQVAVAGGLATTLANATASSVVYTQQKRIMYRSAITLGTLAIPGAVLGSVLAKETEPGIFGILLASALFLASFYIFASRKMRSEAMEKRYQRFVFIPASFFAGVVSAFFGIGGGLVFVPILLMVLGVGVMHAAPASTFAILMTSVVGLASHSVLGHVDVILTLLLSAGALIGGVVGARLSLVMGEKYLRIISAVTTGGAASWLMLDSIMISQEQIPG